MSRDPGPRSEKTEDLPPFDHVLVAGTFAVRIHNGPAAAIRLSGPMTMLEDTELKVNDGKLAICWQEGACWSRNGDHGVDIDLYMPNLLEAMVGEAGSITIDRVEGDRFSATVVGASSITIEHTEFDECELKALGSGPIVARNIDAKGVNAMVSGAGGMKLAGTSERLIVRHVGAGTFDGHELLVCELEIQSHGAGMIRANATETADVNIMGSGDVELGGGAKCKVSKAGSGNVRCN